MDTNRLHPTDDTHLERALLARYLETFNRAVEDAGGRFPYHVVLHALRVQLNGGLVLVELTGLGRPPHRIECCFEGRRLVMSPCRIRPVGACWCVSRQHVYDVIDRPWRYLADPMRFELPPFAVCAARPEMCGSTGLHASEAANSA